jgi:hypothetical protein
MASYYTGYHTVGSLTCLCGSRPDRFEIAVDLASPLHQIEIHLQPKKEPLRQAEITGEPQIGVGRDIPLAKHDLIDTARCDMNRTRQCVLAEAHRFKEFLKQDFAGMRVQE